LAEGLEKLALDGVVVESDYQLRVENAPAVAEAALVVFVDAAVTGEEPFFFGPVVPRSGADYTTHSLGPGQLLGLAEEVFGRSPQSCLLAIRGYSFDMFEEGLTEKAKANLEAALGFLADFLRSRGAAARTAVGAQRLARPSARERAAFTDVTSQGGLE
jgi:Ni,Fe-hydrogenase maturation factor